MLDQTGGLSWGHPILLIARPHFYTLRVISHINNARESITNVRKLFNCNYALNAGGIINCNLEYKSNNQEKPIRLKLIIMVIRVLLIKPGPTEQVIGSYTLYIIL